MFNKKNYVLELDTNLWTQIPISRQGNHKIIRHYILYSTNKPEKSIRNKKIKKLKNDYSQLKIKSKINNNFNKKELVEVNKKVIDHTFDIKEKPNYNTDLDIELLHYSFHEPKVENYSKDFINAKINLPSTSEITDNLHYDEFNELNIDSQNNFEKSEIEKYKNEIEEIKIIENISNIENNKNKNYKLNLPNSRRDNLNPKKTNFSENNICEEKENELLNLPTAWRITSLPSAKTLFEEETQIQKNSKNENYLSEKNLSFDNNINQKNDKNLDIIDQTEENSNKELDNEIFEIIHEYNQKLNNEKINTTINDIQLLGLPKAEIKIKDKPIVLIENFKSDLEKEVISLKLPKAIKNKSNFNQELDNVTKIKSLEKEKINLPKSSKLKKENRLTSIEPPITDLQEMSELRQIKSPAPLPPPFIDKTTFTPPPDSVFHKTSELRQIDESLSTLPPNIEKYPSTPPLKAGFHEMSELRQIEILPPPLLISEKIEPTQQPITDLQETSELRQIESPPPLPSPFIEKTTSTPPPNAVFHKTSELRQIEKSSSTPSPFIDKTTSTPPPITDLHETSELRQIESPPPPPPTPFIEKKLTTPPPKDVIHKTSELRQINESLSTPPPNIKENISTPPPEANKKNDYEIFTQKVEDDKNNQLEKTRSKIFNEELEKLTKDIVNFPNKKIKEVTLIDSKNANQNNKTYLEKISSSYIKLKTSDYKTNKLLNETSNRINDENFEEESQNNLEQELKNENVNFLESNTKIIKDEFSTKYVDLEYKNPYVYEERVSEYLTKLYKKPLLISKDFDTFFEEILKIYQLETKTSIDGLAILSYNEIDNTFKIFLDYNINNKELSNNICFVDNQKIFFPEKFIQELDLVELNKNNNFKKIITKDIINVYKKIFIQKIFLETKNEDEYPLYLLLFYKQNNRFANFTKIGFNDFNPKSKIIIKNMFKDLKIPLLQYRYEIWNKKFSQNSFSILTNNIFQNFSKFAGKGKEPFTCLYFKIESSSSYLKTYDWKIILDNFSQKILEKISDNEKIFILSINKILIILNKSNPKIIVNLAQEFCTQNKFELIHYSKEFPKQGINFFNYLD